ncbi:hypothetical protein N431DRAFT_483523 [Stipitochalara longipes BDJ]|nr:hypothetical protein N431DRAFT_483523 [Stipitochalara longipes BDJ]
MSAAFSASVCTACLRPWVSAQYRTCDSCRARNRSRRRRREPQNQPDNPNFPHNHAPVPFRSSTTLICQSCQQPWISSQYPTCDICRNQRRANDISPSTATNSHFRETRFDERPHESDSLQPTWLAGWVCTHCYQPWYSPRYRMCDNCRALSRARYFQRLQSRENTNLTPDFPTTTPRHRSTVNLTWWERLSDLHVIPFQQKWSKVCTYYSAPLLSKEKLDGAVTARWLDRASGIISSISRRLNNLFAFSAIGATEGFVYFDGLANVVLTGRVYYRLLDLSEGEHSMRWFLYDEVTRERQGIAYSLPLDATQQVRDLLEAVNPYISTIRHTLDQVEDESIPVAVELRHRPADGELAAIINTQNLSTVHPRKVVFFRHGADIPRYVDILSRHYKPLQYPLLFPHGTPGWGYSSTFPFP